MLRSVSLGWETCNSTRRRDWQCLLPRIFQSVPRQSVSYQIWNAPKSQISVTSKPIHRHRIPRAPMKSGTQRNESKEWLGKCCCIFGKLLNTQEYFALPTNLLQQHPETMEVRIVTEIMTDPTEIKRKASRIIISNRHPTHVAEEERRELFEGEIVRILLIFLQSSYSPVISELILHTAKPRNGRGAVVSV